MAVAVTNTDSKIFTDFAATPQSVSVAVGTAAADRLIFAYLHNIDGSSGALISSVTIGGVTATKVTGSYAVSSSSPVLEGVFYWALLAAGTTATLSVSFAITPTDNSLNAIVYRVVGADTATPVSASAADNTGASITITIPASGEFIGGASAVKNGAPPTFISFSNATTDVQINTNSWSGTAVGMNSSTGLSSTAGAGTVEATSWSSTLFQVLSGVAIQQATAAANIDLFTKQLRW